MNNLEFLLSTALGVISFLLMLINDKLKDISRNTGRITNALEKKVK